MKKHSTPALVFNCDYNGLALIQALGRRGVPVLALDSKRGIGTYSRYAKYINVPDPLFDEAGFIDRLISLGPRLSGKPLLLPTNDHWAEAVSRHKERLSVHYSVCVSDLDTVSLLLDKERFGRWGLSQGIPVPYVWSATEALNVKESLEYPIAVKANARRRSGRDQGGSIRARAADRFRFRICNNPAILESALLEARKEDVPVFCQQIVQGRSDSMHTIGVYARHGDIYGIMYAHRNRGDPPDIGDCITGVGGPVPSWAEELAMHTFKTLKYSGIAQFEVMEDFITSERLLIEINPRSWSWVGVAAATGVDLAWLAYSDLVLGQTPQKRLKSCEDGEQIVWAKVLSDFQNTQIWYRFTDARDWVLSLRQWWSTYKGKKRVFAEFSRDDPLVGLVATLQSGKQFLGKSIKTIRTRAEP